VILAALAAVLFASSAAAEHEFGWIAPSGPINHYMIYLGEESQSPTRTVPFLFKEADADGITRTSIEIDANVGHYATITAHNEAGESLHSNEIYVAAVVPDGTALLEVVGLLRDAHQKRLRLADPKGEVTE